MVFELSMHTGVDGWHDIALHVPLRAGSTDHILEVQVIGGFTNTWPPNPPTQRNHRS